MLIIRDVNKPISDMGKKLLIDFDKISLSYTLAKLAIFRQKYRHQHFQVRTEAGDGLQKPHFQQKGVHALQDGSPIHETHSL